MAIDPWVCLPTAWIQEGGLRKLKWKHGGSGSDNIAALMALVAIAHAADQTSGIAIATYDELCEATNLSRAKLSNGLDVLEKRKLIERSPGEKRSTYRLIAFDRQQRGWGKLPLKRMRHEARIDAFKDFKLRSIVELNALKLFLLFIAFRDNSSNLASISYDKIEEYTGIEREKIRSGISLLASIPLVHVERVPSKTNDYGVANAYRIVGLEPYVHMGTSGRTSLEEAKQFFP
jgi:DNA-binding transcriptional ArsR family regulator